MISLKPQIAPRRRRGLPCNTELMGTPGVASLRDLPPDVEASTLSLSWIDDVTTRRVAFALDEWGDVSARPTASLSSTSLGNCTSCAGSLCDAIAKKVNLLDG